MKTFLRVIGAFALFYAAAVFVSAIAAFFLAWGLSELSWWINPGWQRTLPGPLSVIVPISLTGSLLYLTFRLYSGRQRAGQPPRVWLITFMCGLALGHGAWLAGFLVEFRIDLPAVGEQQLLAMVKMPSGFTLYDEGFQGNDVGANRYFVGPAGNLSPDNIGVPDGYERISYTESGQMSDEWDPYLAWIGPSPLGRGECDLALDIAHPDISAYELEGAAPDAREGVRAGTMKAVYLVAYCDLDPT